MRLVLDASVALAWCFEDETTAYTERVLDLLEAGEAIVPAIWSLEIANAILSAERRGRLQPAGAARFTELVQQLPVTVDTAGLEQSLGDVLQLGRNHDLTSYDASYLELAMRLGLPLATLDTKLVEVANRLGIVLVK